MNSTDDRQTDGHYVQTDLHRATMSFSSISKSPESGSGDSHSAIDVALWIEQEWEANQFQVVYVLPDELWLSHILPCLSFREVCRVRQGEANGRRHHRLNVDRVEGTSRSLRVCSCVRASKLKSVFAIINHAYSMS